MTLPIPEARIIRLLRRDRVEVAPTKGAATAQAPEGQPRAAGRPVGRDRLEGVGRAGRREPARRGTAQPGSLVQMDEEEQHTLAGPHASSDPLARFMASITRALNSWNDTPRIPGSTPMRYAPGGKTGANSSATARRRRRQRFRSTAEPTRRGTE